MAQNAIVLLEQKVKTHPERDALHLYDADLKKTMITFKELWTLASRCAALLKENGVKRGDCVYASVPLGPELWVTCFGIVMAGGVPVTNLDLFEDGQFLIDTIRMTKSTFVLIVEDDEDYLFKRLQPYMKSSSESSDDLVQSVAYPETPCLKGAYLVRRSEDRNQGFLEMLKSRTEIYVDRDLKPADGFSVAVTQNMKEPKRPKLALVTHSYITATADKWNTILPGIETFYSPYQWFAVPCLPYDILCGQTRQQNDFWGLNLMERMEVKDKLLSCGVVRNTTTVPQEIYRAIDYLGEPSTPFLDNAIVGGGRMTDSILNKVRTIAKNVFVSYMSTEFLYGTCELVAENSGFKDCYAGKLVEGVRMKVVNKEGEEVPRGQVGEIYVKSDTIFQEYLDDPMLTEQAFTNDGWYRSNDGGYMTPEGGLLVFGRLGDTITRHDIVIPAVIIENAIKQHPDVLEAKVFGVPDPLNGQNVCACVVKYPKRNPTTEELHEYIGTKMTGLTKYMYHVDYIVSFKNSIKGKTNDQLRFAACELLGICANFQ